MMMYGAISGGARNALPISALLVVEVVVGVAVVSIGLVNDLRWQVLLLACLLLAAIVLVSAEPLQTVVFIFVLSMTTQVGMNIPKGPAWHHGGAADVFQLYVYDLLFLASVGIWLMRGAVQRRQSWRIDLVDAAPLGFLAWSTMTVSYSVSPSHSIFQIYLMVKVYLFYIFVRHWAENRRNTATIELALAAGLVIQSLIIFAQFFTQESIGLLGPMEDRTVWFRGEIFNRPGGTIGSDQAVGSYLGLVLPLALAGLLSRLPPRQRALHGGALILGVVALLMTLSRAGWIQFGVAVFVFGLVFVRKISLRGFLLATSVVGALALAILGHTDIGELVQMRLLEFSEVSTFGRLDLFGVAWSMIEANPIFGVGLNTFRFVAPQYDTTGITLVTPVAVHNIPLLLWSETGTVGLFLFFAFPFLVGWRLWAYQRLAGGPMAASACGILAGLVGFFAGGLFDVNYAHQLNIVHFWVVAGLGMAITRMESEAQGLRLAHECRKSTEAA